MAETRDWNAMRELSTCLLYERTGQRVDLGLRLEGPPPGGRLQPGKIHESMPLQIGLARPDEVDVEVLSWLQQTYEQNR